MCGKINKKAFTLAETLMTLMIIGVIAAMTIPALKKSAAAEENIAKLKKQYSTLSQAVMMSENINGPIDFWNFGLDNKTFFDRYLGDYLSVVKSCDSDVDCWGGGVFYPNGTIAFELAEMHKVVLADGTRLGLYLQPTANHGHMFVDLNGAKLPNVVGVDVYFLTIAKKSGADAVNFIDEGGISMYGLGSDAKADCAARGYTCGAMIIMNGWKIPKDYPL